MTPSIDWTLLGRYALLVSLTQLIPVPLVDSRVGNVLRRRLVRAVAERHGAELSDEDVALLGDAVGGGCVGCVWSVVMWPVKKVLRTLLFFLQVKQMADEASEVLHRGLLLEEAFDRGWLPGDTARVRAAMDRSLEKIDTRLVERAVMGVYRDHRSDLNRTIYETAKVARKRARGQRAEAIADAVDDDELGQEADDMSGALAAALRATGVVDELVHWFRAEMGAEPPPEPDRGTTEADGESE